MGAIALMIAATADQIRQIIVADPSFLHGLLTELDRMFGNTLDVGILLEALPEEIARHSPFQDEADIAAVVQAEMRRALYRLTMHMLPVRGTA
jgi:hypothetical protein